MVHLRHIRGLRCFVGLAFLAAAWSGQARTASPGFASSQVLQLPGMKAAGAVRRGSSGIPAITAGDPHDLFLLEGYVHAGDRLFQMDVARRTASGTLAELLGHSALSGDVELRRIGLRRAAEAALPLLAPETRDALEAYADGVNLWAGAHALPPEYPALELSRFEPWTPLDSVCVLKLVAFQLSFFSDLDDTNAFLAFVQAGEKLGFDGSRLFFEDVFRSAPFAKASTIPDALAGLESPLARGPAGSDSRWISGAAERGRRMITRGLPALVRACLARFQPLRQLRLLSRGADGRGSNEWVLSGSHTVSGHPILANDPHLALSTPPIFSPVALRGGPYNVAGDAFAGVPFVILGSNARIAWGATTNPMDVTDFFQEEVVPDESAPAGIATIHDGLAEAVLSIPAVFRENEPTSGALDDVRKVPPSAEVPAEIWIVPRRNNGPLLELDASGTLGLSVQYAGTSPTRELDGLRLWNLAGNLDDFRAGLADMDVGSENWTYADVDGNIAFFTSGEMPLREDLQNGAVNGLPPSLVRDGRRGNEWLPRVHDYPEQALPFEILPPGEMPQIVNPPSGVIVSANNDPVGADDDNDPYNQERPGGGIFYLYHDYRSFRARRIEQLIAARLSAGNVTTADMSGMQADTGMIDAEVFVPALLAAFDRGRSPGADPALAALASEPAIAEAVSRLRAWDFTTPTGILEGYDASDAAVGLQTPPEEEIAASVAATIYSVWRSRMIANTVDAALDRLGGLPHPDSRRALAALRHLLDDFGSSRGVGASGVDFFPAPGTSAPEDRRDATILESLREALDELAGSSYAPAFGRSTELSSYRWGRLHRAVLPHVLGGAFGVPPANGSIPAPLAGLAGIPTDGGFEVVDASGSDARAQNADSFVFEDGPAARRVVDLDPSGPAAVSSLPGGVGGNPGSPAAVALLRSWLVNAVYPVRRAPAELPGPPPLVALPPISPGLTSGR